MTASQQNRLYHDLAWIWDYYSPVEDYAEECKLFALMASKYAKGEVRTLLDIGCGGGKHDYFLQSYFQVTGVDISEEMLTLARKRNPKCFYSQGDMRSFSLGREFDAVLMNDAIPYMTSVRELREAFTRAYNHLRSGGVMLVTPDQTIESFVQNHTETTTVSLRPDKQVDVVIIENTYDSNLNDDTYEITLLYLVRDKGVLRVEQDVHTVGIFTLNQWRETLRAVGFTVEEKELPVHPNNLPLFVCRKG